MTQSIVEQKVEEEVKIEDRGKFVFIDFGN